MVTATLFVRASICQLGVDKGCTCTNTQKCYLVLRRVGLLLLQMLDVPGSRETDWNAAFSHQFSFKTKIPIKIICNEGT